MKLRAMAKPMLVASEVFPIAGRPARMMRSERCSPPIRAIEVGEAGRGAREPAGAIVGGGGHVDGRGESASEKPMKPESKRPVSASSYSRRFAVPLDLVPRRRLRRRIVGLVDRVGADLDERAAQREVEQGAAIILGVDDRRGVGGEAGEVLERRARSAMVSSAPQEGLHRQRRSPPCPSGSACRRCRKSCRCCTVRRSARASGSRRRGRTPRCLDEERRREAAARSRCSGGRCGLGRESAWSSGLFMEPSACRSARST